MKVLAKRGAFSASPFRKRFLAWVWQCDALVALTGAMDNMAWSDARGFTRSLRV